MHSSIVRRALLACAFVASSSFGTLTAATEHMVPFSYYKVGQYPEQRQCTVFEKVELIPAGLFVLLSEQVPAFVAAHADSFIQNMWTAKRSCKTPEEAKEAFTRLAEQIQGAIEECIAKNSLGECSTLARNVLYGALFAQIWIQAPPKLSNALCKYLSWVKAQLEEPTYDTIGTPDKKKIERTQEATARLTEADPVIAAYNTVKRIVHVSSRALDRAREEEERATIAPSPDAVTALKLPRSTSPTLFSADDILQKSLARGDALRNEMLLHAAREKTAINLAEGHDRAWRNKELITAFDTFTRTLECEEEDNGVIAKVPFEKLITRIATKLRTSELTSFGHWYRQLYSVYEYAAQVIAHHEIMTEAEAKLAARLCMRKMVNKYVSFTWQENAKLMHREQEFNELIAEHHLEQPGQDAKEILEPQNAFYQSNILTLIYSEYTETADQLFDKTGIDRDELYALARDAFIYKLRCIGVAQY